MSLLDRALCRASERELEWGAIPGYDYDAHWLIYGEEAGGRFRAFGRRLLAAQLLLAAALPVAARFAPEPAVWIAFFAAFALPNPLAWFAARVALRCERGREMLGDLASSPRTASQAARAAMAPIRGAIASGGWWIAVGASVAFIVATNTLGQPRRGGPLALALAVPAILPTLLAGRRFPRMAALARWRCAFRFGAVAGGALAILHGLRLAAGIAAFMLSGYALAYVGGGGFSIGFPWPISYGVAFMVPLLLLLQTSDLGFYRPREWAKEDDEALDRAGVEGLLSANPPRPGAFASTLRALIWPCPRASRWAASRWSGDAIWQAWNDEAAEPRGAKAR